MSPLTSTQNQQTLAHTPDAWELDVTSTSPFLTEMVLAYSENSHCINRKRDPVTELALCNSIPAFSHIHWRIIPLLLDALTRNGLALKIDPIVNDFLQQKTLQGSIHELLKTKQLNTLLTTLAEHHIPVILLKGTAFSKWLYSETVPRLSSDLDILVKPCDWDKTVALLSRTMSREAKPVEGVFDDLYEISFKPKEEQLGVEIDLHQHLTHPTLFDVDLEGIWSRSVPHPAYQSELTRMMSVSDALIHQALHSFKDAEYKTYNLIDTAYLLKHESVDLDALFMSAQQQGVDVALYGLLSKLANATHNAQLATYLKHVPVSRWRKTAFAHLSKMHVSSLDVLNKTWRYRLLQFGFHAIVSTKPLSMFKLQCSYLMGSIRKART